MELAIVKRVLNFQKVPSKIKSWLAGGKALIILALGIVFLIIYITSPTSIKSQELTSKNQIKYTAAEVPELAQILSPDQKIRLEAARKLVERVDVEEALEILQNSDLPHTGEGHLVVHQIGFYAYGKYGVDSILKCKDYFLYACYHGTIIEAASDQGFEQIAKMTDKCKSSSSRYFQCVHAAGHSILAIWDYDLKNALVTCDELYELETNNFPEALTSCHNGAFMENLFGVHDWGTREQPKRDWISEDLYFPCNAFGEKYQKGCWLNQAARIYQKYSGDLVKTKETCEKIGNKQYTIWCMDNLARQIHPLTNGEVNKVFEMCAELGDSWRDSCVVVNAGSFFSVGDADSAIFICKSINNYSAFDCFNNVISQISSEPLDSSEKRNLCRKIGGYFENQCSWQIQI